MARDYKGRVDFNSREPVHSAVCDRCGFLYTFTDLQWQYDWSGPSYINKKILVCYRCVDDPSEFLKTVKLPPEPDFTYNARPEDFFVDSISHWTLSAPPGAQMFHTVAGMFATIDFRLAFFVSFTVAGLMTATANAGYIVSPFDSTLSTEDDLLLLTEDGLFITCEIDGIGAVGTMVATLKLN